MTELIIAILSDAAGSFITYRAMKSTGQKLENAKALATSENIGLKQRCQALDSVITERRVKDAYQAGARSRDSEVTALHRDVSKLREQVRLEAALDDRIQGKGYAFSGGGKILNISGRG